MFRQMEKRKEKSEGDLLYIGHTFVPVMRFKGKMYVEIRNFECCVRDIQRELENLTELNRQQSKAFDECLKDYRELVKDYMKQEEENKKLKEDNRKLKETIKDHQLYEEKLEHRIIEFEELLHGE